MNFAPILGAPMSVLSGLVDGMITKIFINNPADSAVNILSKPITDYGNLGTLLNNIYTNVFLPLALMLVIIYFFVGLMSKTIQFDQLSIGQIWQQFILIIVCALLLTHGFEILEALLDFGSAVFSDLRTTITGYDDSGLTYTVDAIRDGLGIGNSLKGDLGGFATLVIPWLLSSLFPIIIKAICYMRLIELAVRICMMPISLADFFHQGLHGAGWRNLKAFLAVSLQTVAIYLILYVNQAIMGEVGSSVSDSFIIVYLAVWAATIGLLFRSQSLCKEMVGA